LQNHKYLYKPKFVQQNTNVISLFWLTITKQIIIYIIPVRSSWLCKIYNNYYLYNNTNVL